MGGFEIIENEVNCFASLPGNGDLWNDAQDDDSFSNVLAGAVGLVDLLFAVDRLR
jgi:hypothetical protein